MGGDSVGILALRSRVGPDRRLLAYRTRVGTLNAVALISAACAAAGIVCLSLPRLIDGVNQRRSRNRSPVETTVAVVNDEAKEAVDYFGALQVVGAAFVFGLGAARKLKR